MSIQKNLFDVLNENTENNNQLQNINNMSTLKTSEVYRVSKVYILSTKDYGENMLSSLKTNTKVLLLHTYLNRLKKNSE